MPELKERRDPLVINPLIGDINRLRRKDDLPLREILLTTVSKTSRNSSYLSPVSEKQVEAELAQGYVRALVNGTEGITAHVRCLPISNDTSFIMTLHGKSREQVLEILEQLAQDRTLILETVNKHLVDLYITENDLISAGFERTTAAKLGFSHLVRTNLYYFRTGPLKFVRGLFQKDSKPEEYIVFIRRKKQ